MSWRCPGGVLEVSWRGPGGVLDVIHRRKPGFKLQLISIEIYFSVFADFLSFVVSPISRKIDSIQGCLHQLFTGHAPLHSNTKDIASSDRILLVVSNVSTFSRVDSNQDVEVDSCGERRPSMNGCLETIPIDRQSPNHVLYPQR